MTGLDVSATAVEITGRVLDHYGLSLAGRRTASVLDTGYPDGAFDGAVCFSVLDHMTVPDAKKALRELWRIIRPGGLLLLALDAPEADDLAREHTLLPDGSIRYPGGMILHPYDAAAAEELLAGLPIVHRGSGPKGENVFIIEAQ